jgi:hypothetical protein
MRDGEGTHLIIQFHVSWPGSPNQTSFFCARLIGSRCCFVYRRQGFNDSMTGEATDLASRKIASRVSQARFAI